MGLRDNCVGVGLVWRAGRQGGWLQGIALPQVLPDLQVGRHAHMHAQAGRQAGRTGMSMLVDGGRYASLLARLCLQISRHPQAGRGMQAGTRGACGCVGTYVSASRHEGSLWLCRGLCERKQARGKPVLCRDLCKCKRKIGASAHQFRDCKPV